MHHIAVYSHRELSALSCVSSALSLGPIYLSPKVQKCHQTVTKMTKKAKKTNKKTNKKPIVCDIMLLTVCVRWEFAFISSFRYGNLLWKLIHPTTLDSCLIIEFNSNNRGFLSHNLMANLGTIVTLILKERHK